MPARKKDRAQQLRDVEAALKRASQRAEEIARQTGTALILWEDGKIVKYYPSDQDSESEQQSK